MLWLIADDDGHDVRRPLAGAYASASAGRLLARDDAASINRCQILRFLGF